MAKIVKAQGGFRHGKAGPVRMTRISAVRDMREAKQAQRKAKKKG